MECAIIVITALHTSSKRIIWKNNMYEKVLYLLGENVFFIILPIFPLQEFLQSNVQLIADFWIFQYFVPQVKIENEAIFHFILKNCCNNLQYACSYKYEHIIQFWALPQHPSVLINFATFGKNNKSFDGTHSVADINKYCFPKLRISNFFISTRIDISNSRIAIFILWEGN